MSTPTTPFFVRTIGTVAVALLFLFSPMLPAGAQGTLRLSFERSYDVYSTSNDETMADYQDNIVVSPASAKVACTPEIGSMFPRGATRVECTATLGAQTQRGGFYLLVAQGDDTDVELGPVSQDFTVVEPAGFVTYNVEYRTTVPTTARKVEISTTLPAQAKFISTSEPNCDISKLPKISCVVFSVRQADSLQITVQARPPFQGTYRVNWSLRLLADDDTNVVQRDLLAANNNASIDTVVRVAQAPNKLFLPTLQK